jgi:hypothetical protein
MKRYGETDGRSLKYLEWGLQMCVSFNLMIFYAWIDNIPSIYMKHVALF